MFQYRTIEIRAELLNKTMTRIVYELIQFSWNVATRLKLQD